MISDVLKKLFLPIIQFISFLQSLIKYLQSLSLFNVPFVVLCSSDLIIFVDFKMES